MARTSFHCLRDRRPVSRCLLALAVLVLASVAHAVTVPSGFTVKNTFSGTTLGLPVDLGGLTFSPDGNTLYVVGAVDSTSSGVYALGVTRNATTHAVTNLVGPACLVFSDGLQQFSGTGLDAGLEFGPSGRLFYTYFDIDRLGERNGTVGCIVPPAPPTSTEKTYTVSGVLPSDSVAGLTFSPLRIDPATGFGVLHTGMGYGNNIYEVTLAADTGGFFMPSSVTLFVTLPNGSLGNIQYVPSAPVGAATPHAGDLMYAAYAAGEVHYISMDTTTGLPKDKTTGMPLQGTA